MKVRLHEIEFGSKDVNEDRSFYQTVLGLTTNLSHEGLTVLNSGTQGIDLNLSNHFLPGVVAISFLTDDLDEVERRLKEAGIFYEEPTPSHLGMTSLQLKHPDGYLIKINTPGRESPSWLQV